MSSKRPSSLPSGGGALSSQLARSLTIYLNRGGALLRPGNNDARLSTLSIVQEPTLLTPWDIDDEVWGETVACVRELYARFDVTLTDEDPGDVPHIEAVFGGHPSDVGLPDNVAGVSPFTTDCGVIESSVVFTFTDVLPDDPRLMCEVMAQDIAHSFGADHELLAEDPMTYLDYGERSFQDELASCSEDVPRPYGIDTHVCWERARRPRLCPPGKDQNGLVGPGLVPGAPKASKPLVMALASLVALPRPSGAAPPSTSTVPCRSGAETR